jgi:hypothetical protein
MRALFVIVAAAIVVSATSAGADNTSSQLAAEIRCSDFRKLADGTYLSSLTARLGAKPFANQSVGPVGYNFGDGKLFNAIAAKCGH